MTRTEQTKMKGKTKKEAAQFQQRKNQKETNGSTAGDSGLGY